MARALDGFLGLAAILLFAGGCSSNGSTVPMGSGGIGGTSSGSGGSGAPSSVCPVGQSQCGTECVSLSSSSLHCGSCTTVCGAGQSCVNSQCVCGQGLLLCAGSCVDVTQDPNNCGACGVVCPAGGACQASVCACQSGRTLCSGACADLQSDGNNCGACGAACPAGQLCSAGVCGDSCTVPGQTPCGQSCVDLMTDAVNCGACGVACAPGQACTNGTCGCGTGLTLCSGVCINTNVDPANCGACGVACTGGQACSNGTCACSAGQSLCNTQCTTTATDPSNCGSCGVACAAGQTCQNGICVGEVAGTGGAGSGGAPAGGSATGGVSTGGTATGGVSTGGTATGGVSTGGTATGGVSTGGTATGGVSTGGTATGGVSTGGAATGGASTGGSSGTWYPCGDTSGYNATAIKSGSTWTVQNGGNTVYTGSSMEEAMVEAYGSLSSGRTSKESVLIQGDGDISGSSQVRIPSYTIVNVCGTINVSSTGSGDVSPMYARGATNIDIPNATITGTPSYGIFFRETSNVHFGRITLNLSSGSGIGIRIDHSSSSAPGKAMYSNYQIDYVEASGSGSQGLETYGIDNITINEFVGENIGECGVLLNYTTNAEVGSVTCTNCGAGTGYAAFRIANQAGNVGDNGSYPAGNIHVGEVNATGGGRGIFCVSASGGLTIDRFTVTNAGTAPEIFMENCYNVTLAAESGTLTGGNAHIGHNSDNGAMASNVIFQNMTLNSSTITEASELCSQDRGNRARNITGGTVDMCFSD